MGMGREFSSAYVHLVPPSVCTCARLSHQSIRSKYTQLFPQDPDVVLSFLAKGRLARVVDGDTDWGWGAVVDYKVRWLMNAHVSLLPSSSMDLPRPKGAQQSDRRPPSSTITPSNHPTQAVDGGKAKAGRTLGTAAALAGNVSDSGGWVHVVDVCLRVKKGSGEGGARPEPYDGKGAWRACLHACDVLCA